MALGNILKEARMRRNLSASEVAAGTRMKIQLVQAIEREDFSAFPAKIYGKGFIKLYAELVGVDPIPLIEEYITALDNNNAAPPKPAPKPKKVLMKSVPPEDVAVTDTPVQEPETPPEQQQKTISEQPQNDTNENNQTVDLFSLAETKKQTTDKNTTEPTIPDEPQETVTPVEEEKEQTISSPVFQADTDIIGKENEQHPLFDDSKIVSPTRQEPEINAADNREEQPEQKETIRQTEKTEVPPIKPKPILESLSYLEQSNDEQGAEKESPLKNLFPLQKIDFSNYNLKAIGISLAGLILIIFIISSISRCSHRTTKQPAAENNTLQLAFPPDDLYLE